MAGDASRFNGKKGGRPKGSKAAKTLERDRVMEAYRQRVHGMADSLLNSQVSLAVGQQFLYRIETDKDGKKSKPILVTDPEEITAFLDWEYGDGENVNTEGEYYYISTKEPDNAAIEGILNRAWGRPKETVEVQGDFTLKVDF